MRQKSLEELKAELKWMEETPFYMGNDGLPSGLILLFIILSGVILGIIIVMTFRFIKKKLLKRKIAKLI